MSVFTEIAELLRVRKDMSRLRFNYLRHFGLAIANETAATEAISVKVRALDASENN